MLTQTTGYALQTLAYLAKAPREWREVRRISDDLAVPGNYLSKVLGQLARAGFLESRRGRGGGFRLKQSPARIRLGRVVRALEGVDRGPRCAFGWAVCSDENPCPFHHGWKQIVEIREQMLATMTVADLVREPGAGAKRAGTRLLSPVAGRAVQSRSRAKRRD